MEVKNTENKNSYAGEEKITIRIKITIRKVEDIEIGSPLQGEVRGHWSEGVALG